MNRYLKPVSLLFLFATACSSAPPSNPLSLLPSKQDKLSFEEERLRKMQMVQVVDETGHSYEWNVYKAQYAFSTTCSNGPTTFDCAGAVGLGTSNYCQGEVLLAMAGLTPAALSTEFQDPDLNYVTHTYTVPPQSAATNAALATVAASWFEKAMTNIVNVLTIDSPDFPCTAADFVNSFGSTSERTSAVAGAVFRDAYRAAMVAHAGIVSNTLAVADAQLADAPTFQLGMVRTYAGRSLSRVAAAHLLLGGKPGFAGDSTRVLCNSPRLPGPARRALEIFREAGVSPVDVLQEPAITTEELVDSDQLLPNGSVRNRLDYFDSITIPTNQKVWEYYGLTAADFGQARQALKDEINIFSRSLTRQLADHTIPHGTPRTFAKYAATASPPTERDPVYWMALTLTESSDSSDLTGGTWRNIAQYSDSPGYLGASEPPDNCGEVEQTCDRPPVMSQIADYGHSWANYILSAQLTGDPDVVAAIKTDLIAPVAMLAETGDREGRITQCTDPILDTSHPLARSTDIKVYGFSSTDGLILVPGDDNLECATRGSVEGAPCELTGVLQVDRDQPTYQFSHGTTVTTTLAVLDTPAAGEPAATSATQRWYVLAPRQPGAVPLLGGWKAIAGFVPYAPPSSATTTQCRDIPIVPEAIEAAAKALAPSPDWCGKATYECDGVRFDERLPLEDELTNDNDGVESSWKHYLTLAHTAATQADSLGEAYLNAAQAVDVNTQQVSLRQQSQQEKAAAEIETLQSICGTTVDPTDLLKALGTASATSASLGNVLGSGMVLGSPCTSGSPPLDGFDCVGATRVLNWRSLVKKQPRLKPLADCLAGFDDTTEVGLGDTALCKKGNSVTLGAEGKDCNAGPCPADTQCVSPKQSLGFFHSPTAYPATLPTVCAAIRTLRKTPGDQAALKQVVDSESFTTGALRTLAANANVHLDYGGFVTAHVGGASYSTQSPAGTWPCGLSAVAADCATGDGLFCNSWDCSLVNERAGANSRLYWAVVAAKLLTWDVGSGTPTIETPALLYKSVGPLNARTDTSSVRVGPFPVTTFVNDRWRMFDADSNGLPQGDPSRQAVTLGTWDGSSFIDVMQPDTYVAIEEQPIDERKLKPRLLGFWGGLAPGAGGGYVERLLAGEDWNIVPKDIINLADDRARPGSLSTDYGTLQNGCNPSTKTCPFGGELADDFKVYGLGHGPGHTSGSLPYDNEIYVHAGRSLITQFDVSSELAKTAVLDDMELFCDGMTSSTDSIVPGGNCNGGHPPEVKSVSDLDNLGGYMECLGDDITRRMVTTLFENVPTAVVDGLLHAGQTNKAGGGELDTAISNMREALDTVASSGPSIGGTVHRFGQDVRALRAQLEAFDISNKIDDVQLESQKANQITSCLSAMADAISGVNPTNPASGPAGAAKEAATCANSAAQIGFAININSLQKDQNTAEREKAIAEFGGRFGDYVTALQTQSGLLSGAIEHVYGSLSIIEGVKEKADRAVDNALWLLSEQAAKQGEIASVLTNVSDGSRIRYERALSNARRTASLARRAIEQRLGVSLDDMVDDLPLVSAPATWASKVCTTTGIDYKALTSATGKISRNGGATTLQGLNFADAFIGDYVDKLDQVVESYRLKNNFHEGTDTAVVSLRDDIDATRASCDVNSRNILLNASNLSTASIKDPGAPGWAIAGCTTETVATSDDSFTRSLPNCVGVTQSAEAPFLQQLVASPILGYGIRFSDGTSACPGCGWNPGVALQQTVALAAGRYRLSWYTKDAPEVSGFVSDSHMLTHYTTTPETTASGIVKTSAGTVLHAVSGLSGFIAPANVGDWSRAYFVFDVPAADSISVAFKYPGGGHYAINVAAPMLEKLDDPVGVASTFRPQSFADTGDTRTVRSPVCQDTDGAVFREKKWKYGCAKLCPDGYASDCRDRAQQECYWETSFNINQNGIDTGTLFGASGFARGNFNYRIDTIGLNFVGTGLRDCQNSMLPTTCNAAGFVPYSIYHEGPYFVRNHKGEDFESFLFTASIEHARGLGTERYLTNPISQADSGLITPYFRQEFQGRPLDGDFVVRVWDADGLNFNAIQDVQVVLNYRYWTRFN